MKILIAEKVRLQGPNTRFIKASCQFMIDTISDQIKLITNQISSLIGNNETLNPKKAILKSISGIGDNSAGQLLILLPELGTLGGKQIAALTGLAPRNNDSGMYRGYRCVMNGRDNVKPILFMVAMAARRSKTDFRSFYEKLICQ
jgi:transposase